MTDLRPASLNSFVGQPKAVGVLSNVINASISREEFPRHVLFTGPAGVGKTSLALLIAREMCGRLKSYHAATIRNVSDMAAIILEVHSGDVVFIDEIHSLPAKPTEMLFTCMEDAVIDLIMGDAHTRVPLRWQLPQGQFCVVGATTRVGKLPTPLLKRFGEVLELDFYSNQDLATILGNDAAKLGLSASSEAIFEIAKRGRGTPRDAIRLLQSVRDYADANGLDVTPEVVSGAMDTLGVDPVGLTELDKRYLMALIEKFNHRPAGINALTQVLNVEVEALFKVVEPWLLRLGFVRRTERGRMITVAGIQHLGLTVPEGYEG
mgnify:CR=1 FL=1